MSSHYFINDPNLKDDERIIKHSDSYHNHLIFKTNTGLFAKDKIDYASQLLVDNIDKNRAYQSYLDLCCGYGYIGIHLAHLINFKQISFCDINEKAIFYTNENIQLNNIHNADAFVSDGINSNLKYDLITLNPPIRAGKEVIFKIYNDAFNSLNEEGVLYVVIQKKHGALSSYTYLNNLFSSVETIYKKKNYYIFKALR
ncbi:MAG: class I SAM-dependent methyltransferase [Bacilli bacterium]